MKKSGVVHVIDDNPLLLKAMEMILAFEGLNVRAYSSALAFLDGPGEAGCVVTDLEMPGMSGAELLAAISRRALALPVIVVSGRAEPALVQSMLDAGAADYLAKPFQPQMLIDAVREALRGDAAIGFRANAARAHAAE